MSTANTEITKKRSLGEGDVSRISRTYECYNDSGVAWLGEIPEHWSVKRFKHIFKEKKKSTNVNLGCGSISFGEVVYKDDEKVPESTKRSYQILNVGDFLINPLNLNYDLKSLRIALSDKDVVVSSGYIIVENVTDISKIYYKWLLHIFDVTYMKTLGSGVRQTLSFNHIANSKLILPPPQEQTAIAQFLDDKTTKIDQAIAIKERQIELLQERKQLLVHKAVTRGLDDSVPLKDSGVEWIGAIPEHWEVKKLKHVSDKFMYGTSVDCNELTKGTPVLRIPNIGKLKVKYNGLKYASLSKKETQKYLLCENDILIVRTNGNPALVGSSIFKGDGNYMFASYLIKVKPKENIAADFLIQTMNSYSVRESLTFSARTSAGNYNLNTQSLGDCYLAYPPFREQKQITIFIETATQKIKTGINLKQQEIAKLKEYKSSLINSVVTGKIRIN